MSFFLQQYKILVQGLLTDIHKQPQWNNKLRLFGFYSSVVYEKYPLTEMYYCGRRDNFRDIDELNKLINDGFPNCQKADIQPMQVIF